MGYGSWRARVLFIGSIRASGIGTQRPHHGELSRAVADAERLVPFLWHQEFKTRLTLPGICAPPPRLNPDFVRHAVDGVCDNY